MPLVASIKFSQGISVGTAGQAFKGVAGTVAHVTNVTTIGPTRYVFTILDVPPGSAIPLGVVQDGAGTTYNFTPDKPGGYFFKLDVYDSLLNVASDARVFQVPNTTGRIIPPFNAEATQLNFSGQTRGYSPTLEEWLNLVDTLQPLFVGDLATLKPQPNIARQFQVIDGYASTGDGGGGIFQWRAGDTRPDDGGHIKRNAGSGGNWVRVLEGVDGYSVRNFGATGLGIVADESTAVNRCALAVKAATDRNAVANPAVANGPDVFFPSGLYNIAPGSTAGQIQIANGMKVRGQGSGDSVVIRDLGHTHDLMRTGAFNNQIENITFIGGKSAIVFWGPAPLYGVGVNLDSTTSFGTVAIRNCRFRGNAGPSIYLDTSVSHRGSPSTLVVDECDFYTQCVCRAGFDAIRWKGGAILSTQAPGAGPDWGVAVNDDAGHPMPIFYTYDSLTLDTVFITPGADGTTVPSVYVWRGKGNLTMKDCHIGGESSLGVLRSENSNVYRGQDTALDGFGATVEIRLFDNILACTSRGSTSYVSGRNVLEAYDLVPAVFDMRQSSANGTGGVAGVGLVWIDSVTIPKTAYTNVERNITYWNIEGFPDTNFSNLIRTGTNPESPDGENVTPYFLPYMTERSWPRTGQAVPAGQPVNLWPANKQSLATADAMPGSSNGAIGAAETRTGYGLVPWVASAFPSSVRADFYHVTDGLPRGFYVLSFHVLSDVSSNIQVRAIGNDSSPLNVIDNLSFVASSQLQRMYVTFYHNGARSNGFAFTSFALPFANGVNPQTAHFYIGMFQLEPGHKPTEFGTGHATQIADGAVVRQYYVNGAPPSAGGPFRTGDIAWNINFQLSNTDYWRCDGGGSPGSWQVGNTLAFDPSQAPGYSGDFDAALLAPGAITAWNDKSGAVPYNPQNLAGHATAFASGGTGPGGASYVKAVAASSDFLTFLRSSVPFANEGFLVVRWDNAGPDTTGTLFDGGILNSFHLERNASATQFILSGDGGTHPTVSTGDQSAWEIWHFSADAITLKLDVGGTSRLSVASAAGGISNGLTLFARGASGGGPADYSNVSLARAIFYLNPGSTLTTQQRNNVMAYLNAKYSLGVVGAGDIVKERTVTTATDSMATDDVMMFYNRAGGISETLPPVIGGKETSHKNIGGAGNATILPNAGELIEGAATLVLTPGQAVDLRCDGTNWYIF